MKSFKELKAAINSKTILVWDDPDPVKDCDYTINYIEPIKKDFDKHTPIIIRYGEAETEAEVYLHEILTK